MRHYLKAVIIAAISFYVAYSLIPTIHLGDNPQNILIIIAGILITNLIIRPIFSLILLPINFLTFGALSLILNIVFIFALSRFIPGFFISAYSFPGANIQGFIIPPANLNQMETALAVATTITLVQKTLHIIFE